MDTYDIVADFDEKKPPGWFTLMNAALDATVMSRHNIGEGQVSVHMPALAGIEVFESSPGRWWVKFKFSGVLKREKVIWLLEVIGADPNYIKLVRERGPSERVTPKRKGRIA